MKDMPCVFRNSVIINRSIEIVFAFVTDPVTTTQWQTDLVGSEILTPGPMRIGTRVKEVRQVGNAKKQVIWEITMYEPPIKRNYVYIDKLGPFRKTGCLLFTFLNERTLLQSTIVLEADFPFNLFLPILSRRMQTQNERDYARLKQILEAERG